MRRWWGPIASVGLLLAVASLPSVAAQALDRPVSAVLAQGPVGDGTPPVGNVLLIGWDGAQRAHVQECISRGEFPNLVALGAEGALVDIDIYEQTDTKAGWSQILTGYNADVTGVYNNSHYQPIPAGYTLFERLETYFGADAIGTWAVIGKLNHVGAAAPRRIALNAAGQPVGVKGKRRQQKLLKQGTVLWDAGAPVLVIPGEPYYFTQNHIDHFENGLGANDTVGERALAMLAQFAGQPFCAFVHFADVDHMGHKFGENSQEYNEALRSCDAWLGRLRAKLDELGLADRTWIYVTADHGFDEGQRQHKAAPYVFLSTNDPLVTRAGTRADITPTILARYGLKLARCVPPLSGAALY